MAKYVSIDTEPKFYEYFVPVLRNGVPMYLVKYRDPNYLYPTVNKK